MNNIYTLAVISILISAVLTPFSKENLTVKLRCYRYT